MGLDEEEGMNYEELARHLVYDSINDEDAVKKVVVALQDAHNLGIIDAIEAVQSIFCKHHPQKPMSEGGCDTNETLLDAIDAIEGRKI